MIAKGTSFQGAGKKAFLIVALLVVIPAFALSMSAFIADRYAVAVERILDDPLTEERDMLDISEESINAYRKAIKATEKARSLEPLNSDHARALADLYLRIKVWQETMQTVGVAPPRDLPPGKELREAAVQNANKAVTLDPANADHRLALGQMYAADGKWEAALDQLHNAVDSFPVNGAIRYAAALQMLLIGLNDQAQEHARLLAKIDDSYRLDDGNLRSIMMRERMTSGYETRLVRSYLYRAMEITWRTSARDQKAVLAIVPENVDAKEAARLFFEQKGIDVDRAY